MPQTPEGWTLVEAHRLAQLQIASGVSGDVSRLWPLLNPADLDGSFPRFSSALSTLVRARRTASAGLAAGFYRSLRDLEKVPGAFEAVSGAAIEADRLAASLAVTGPATWKRAVGKGANPLEASLLAQAATVGAARRHVLDGGRQTQIRTVYTDDKAHGWQRVSDGRPCSFCAMLVSRGAVYKTEGTASFRTHDHCGCQPVPFWERSPEQTAQAVEFRDLYNASTGAGTDSRPDYRARPATFRRAYEAKYGRKATARPLATDSQAAAATARAVVAKAAREPWTELSKDEALARVIARAQRMSANPNAATDTSRIQARLNFRRDDLKHAQTRRDQYLADLKDAEAAGDPHGYANRWRTYVAEYEAKIAEYEAEILTLEDSLAAIARGDLPPAMRAAAEKHARTHRIFVSGEHEFHLNRSTMKRAGITEEDVQAGLDAYTRTLDRLPEWRLTDDLGRERGYTVVVDGQAQKHRANGFTYRGNDTVWMNPALLKDARISPGYDRGAWSMPAHRTVSAWEYTLTHEFGHTVDNYANAVEDSFRWAMDTNGGDARVTGNLSTYGRSKATEAYAELFAEWALGDRTNPIVAYYADRYGWGETWADYGGVWKTQTPGMLNPGVQKGALYDGPPDR